MVRETEENVRLVTNHFMQKGSTGLPKWQIENVVRNYITTNGKDRMEGQDYEQVEDLIRRKETGGLPGTNVKVSPKGQSPERMRTIAAGMENDLDKKYIDISLKSSVDKLPALKQVKPDREAADF